MLNSWGGAVLLWCDCRAQAANWLTLKKTVFPGWTRGNKGNRMLLSGLADAKIKEYSWLRVNTPHFLVHHCAFDHTVFAFVWKQRGQLLTYFFFCQLVVNSCDFPPHGSGACCLLLTLGLHQQVAPVRRDVFAIITLGCDSLFDFQHSWMVEHM